MNRALSRQDGFTLIELMIVVAIIAIIASVAVPNLLASKAAASEGTAIATLRTLVSVQSQFRSVSAVDSDSDGAGEFGTFGEMSGLILMNARGVGPATRLSPPMLGPPFEQIDLQGRARKAGYYLRVYLPDAARLGLQELAGGGPDPLIAPDNAEYAWSVYAWPIEPRISGYRAFYVDHRGEILQTKMDGLIYNQATAPAFDAALTSADMAGQMAIGVVGQDNNTWTPVQ